jgi:adenosylcobinamide-phosphate synthase
VTTWRTAAAADAAGLIAGYALDAALGDPRRLHPVAGFGAAAGALERRLYAPKRRAGVAYTALAVGVPVLAGAAAAALTRDRPIVRAALVAAGAWTVLGGRTLRREARIMAGYLEGGDLPQARARLNHLCGREPSGLNEPELARATVESVAENTSDAVVAPLFWGGVAGLPGLLGYRAVNTLDAMVGHRSERYARFGMASARLDDLLNLAPSRLTGLLIVAAAPAAGGSREEAIRVWRRDRNDHPSPNAGQCEAAMAGALEVRVGGRNVYHGRTEVRPLIGDGPRPSAGDVRKAARLSGVVGAAALVVAAGVAVARGVVQRGAERISGRTAAGAGRALRANRVLRTLRAGRALPASRASRASRALRATHKLRTIGAAA